MEDSTAKQNIGVCTWIYGDLALTDLASRLHSFGFDGVELMGKLDAYEASEARQILADQALNVFSLTPDNVDLAHPDSAIRDQAIDYYLRLLDFAAEFGNPLVSCHGYVGRIRPITTQDEERDLLLRAVQTIAARAQENNLRLVIEVLNRYESHLLCTGAETMTFLDEVGAENVGILLDAYHMNIEEADPPAALRRAGSKLGLYHVADSNRQGIGRGHTDFGAQMTALTEIDYHGPIIIECTAPGPDPFAAIKNAQSRKWLDTYLQESLAWLRKQRR